MYGPIQQTYPFVHGWGRCKTPEAALAGLARGSDVRQGELRVDRHVERLPHGGEGRRHQQLVVLPDRPHPGLGRPRAASRAGGLTDAGALGEILVHPSVDEFVQPAELARPAGRQG